jgi:pyrimidine-specific ribonucleoside hydrolase
LLRVDPSISTRLKQIVFMGGAMSVGSATPVAEFNVWSDPEAAAIVLTADCPITMYGLDVFYDVVVALDDIAALIAAPDNAPAQLAGALLAYMNQMDRIEGRVAGPTSTTIGDAGAVCAVIDPTALTTRKLPVGIVLDGQAARGQTIVDRRARKGEGDHPDLLPMTTIDVAVGADSEGFRRIFLSGLMST